MMKRKLKHFLIYPKFQLSIVALQISVLIPTFGLLKGFIRNFFYNLHQMGLDSGLPKTHPYFKFVQSSETVLDQKVLILFVISLILMTLFSLLLSHKLAGPICRLKNYFTKIEKTASVEPLYFRKGDFFMELPTIINSALLTVVPPKEGSNSNDK